jgi:hypothetical protein
MAEENDGRFFSKEVRRDVRKTWQHRFRVSNKLASHLAGAVIIILGMEALEMVIKFTGLGVLFDGLPFAFPLRWIVNASDLAVLVGFLVRGVLVMWKAEGDE